MTRREKNAKFRISGRVMGRVSIAITIEFYVTVFALRSWLIIEMSIKMLIGKERERDRPL